MYNLEEQDNAKTTDLPPGQRERVLDQLSTFTQADFDYVLRRLDVTRANVARQARLVGATNSYNGAASGQAEEPLRPGPVSRGVTLENVERVFTYHAWDPRQVGQAEPVKEAIVQLAKTILRNVPDCPDRTVALRKLRELRMDVNAAITHRGEF